MMQYKVAVKKGQGFPRESETFHTWSSPILSCIDVWDLPILQKTDPNIIADATDILARTLFVGPSREA